MACGGSEMEKGGVAESWKWAEMDGSGWLRGSGVSR